MNGVQFFYLKYSGGYMLYRFLFFTAIIGCALPVLAEDSFFESLVETKEIKQKTEANMEKEQGQLKAGKILDSAPVSIKLDENLKIQKAETEVEEIAPVAYEPAPFGLKWLAPIEEIQYMGVSLRAVEIKDGPNSYIASGLPKPLKAFREVLVSFGDKNSLWRIAGYGQFFEDDTRASKGVAEYKKYFDMLSQKYGQAEEFYTPAVYSAEESLQNPDGTTSKSIYQKSMEIGEEGFKEKLMSGEAVLYATFARENIGVTLALLADAKGQTYIIVDYKNLKLNEMENEEIFDAL